MSHGVYILSVFIHVIAACTWIGGMLFLILVFIPGIKKHPDKVSLIADVSLKYRGVGAVALTTLFITGILQLEYHGVQWTVEYFTTSSYGVTAGLKIIVFTIIVIISLIHDYYLGTKAIDQWKNQPDHAKTKTLRTLSRFLSRVSFILALVAAWLGIILVRGW